MPKPLEIVGAVGSLRVVAHANGYHITDTNTGKLVHEVVSPCASDSRTYMQCGLLKAEQMSKAAP